MKKFLNLKIITILILSQPFCLKCHIQSGGSGGASRPAPHPQASQPKSPQGSTQQSSTYTYDKNQGLKDNLENYGVQKLTSYLDQQNNNNDEHQQNDNGGAWTAGQPIINDGTRTYKLDTKSGLYVRTDNGEKYALDAQDQKLINIEDGTHTVRNVLLSLAGGTALGAAGAIAYGKYKSKKYESDSPKNEKSNKKKIAEKEEEQNALEKENEKSNKKRKITEKEEEQNALEKENARNKHNEIENENLREELFSE